MTAKQKSTPAMSKQPNGKTVRDGMQIIRDLHARGRAFTNARNGVVAHFLATGNKQADIVTATGLDKGDVSRIAGYLNKGNNGKTGEQLTRAAKRLTVNGIDVDTFETIAGAARLGADLVRIRAAKTTPGAKTTPAGTGDTTPAVEPKTLGTSEDVSDLIALHAENVFDAYVSLTGDDRRRYAAAIADALRNAEIKVAEDAAVADAA